MVMRPIHKTFVQCFAILLFLLLHVFAFSQDFYVSAPINVPVGNKAYGLSLSGCNTQEIFSCPPTNNIGQYPENQFTDIAIDKDQNLYWVSGWGSFYKRKLSDPASCQFLGTFNNSQSINALVADSAATMYAAGNFGGVCILYKYAAGVFSTLGNLPAGIFSAGDLFFYEQRLFLTATDGNLTRSFLVEINTSLPELSCEFMSLENYQPYGAFSIQSGTSSKAYIICTNSPTASSLREINMSNKGVSGIICNYPFLVTGAASQYRRTSNNTVCTQVVPNPGGSTDEYMQVQNPCVTTTLRIFTNIPASDIGDIRLYNVSGALIKKYPSQHFPNNIEVGNLASGMYLLRLAKKNGETLTRKIIKMIH
jgi:hypothetical protein